MAMVEAGGLSTILATDQKTITLVVGPPGCGKTSLCLFIAQKQLSAIDDKLVYVQNDYMPFKAGRFCNEQDLSLNLANTIYQAYPSQFDHMIQSDALLTVQMTRLLPEQLRSRKSFILDEIDSELLLREFLFDQQQCSAVLCFQDFGSIPNDIKTVVLNKTMSVFIASPPVDFIIDYNSVLYKHPELFGKTPERVSSMLAKPNCKAEAHAEFVLCQRGTEPPQLYRQWIDGDVDMASGRG